MLPRSLILRNRVLDNLEGTSAKSKPSSVYDLTWNVIPTVEAVGQQVKAIGAAGMTAPAPRVALPRGTSPPRSQSMHQRQDPATPRDVGVSNDMRSYRKDHKTFRGWREAFCPEMSPSSRRYRFCYFHSESPPLYCGLTLALRGQFVSPTPRAKSLTEWNARAKEMTRRLL